MRAGSGGQGGVPATVWAGNDAGRTEEATWAALLMDWVLRVGEEGAKIPAPSVFPGLVFRTQGWCSGPRAGGSGSEEDLSI